MKNQQEDPEWLLNALSQQKFLDDHNDHLKILLRGVEVWNEWLAEQRAKHPNDYSPVFMPALRMIDLRRNTIHGSPLIHPIINKSGAYLLLADLEYADISNSDLQNCYFIDVKLDEAFLSSSKLQRAHLKDTSLSGAHLHKCNFQYAQLINVKIKGADFSEANFKDAELIITELDKKTSFRNTRFANCFVSVNSYFYGIAIHVLAQGIVQNVEFADPIFGRKVRDQAWLNQWIANIRQRMPMSLPVWFTSCFMPGPKNSLKYIGGQVMRFFWWITSDYGRKTWPWILWSSGIVFLFALIFKRLGISHFHIDRIPRESWGFGAYLYYSVVTFTTLGFGDITAKTHIGMFWASLEVILGYIMLGGLISIFATKVARRND